MDLRTVLILLTLVSVVADTMLLPFYPQFFAAEFDNHSPEHVGYYIAACCFTVMITFPLWAKVARKINEFHLWVYTQIMAGLLGISCYFVDSLVGFWVLSQTMLVFKASYLLIYPFVMRLESQHKHLGVASLFSVLMHFGAIGGAVIGGFMLEYITPRSVYLIMASTDALQVAVCLYIIKRQGIPLAQPEMLDASENEPPTSRKTSANHVYVLGLISLLFYCSAFLIRPFFTRFWEKVSLLPNELVTGFVYSIPGWIALIGLWFNQRQTDQQNHFKAVLHAFYIAMIGAAIQGIESSTAVLLGRCIYGWGLFQATVRLEVLLFELSNKENYASDFSKVHLFQNVGVLGASFAVGSLVSHFSLQIPFWFSFFGFALTAVTFVVLCRQHIFINKPKLQQESPSV